MHADVVGSSWFISVKPGTVREEPGACPTHRGAAIRPLVPAPRPGFGPLQQFGFGPLCDALDRVEHQGGAVAGVLEELRLRRGDLRGWGVPAHAALVRWTTEMVPRFLAARAAEQRTAAEAGLPPSDPIPWPWVVRTARTDVPDARGARQYEHTVWGRAYASADGTLRDLWLPSFGQAKEGLPEAELAAIAYVLLNGEPEPRRRRGSAPPPSATRTKHPPHRLRVFSFGCADGSWRTLLDWRDEQVQEQFVGHAAPAFHRAATDTGARPGPDCVECKAISRCQTLQRTPRLWHGRPTVPARRRRSLSAWDLRLYAQCPAQYHLTRHLRLTSLQQESDAARRGRAVDAWLNEAHRSRRPRGCRELPGPTSATSWSAGGYRLEGALAQEGAAMLREHQSLCPLDGLGEDEQVLVQHRVTTYVPELDVVVIAVPDLLHTRAGGWVWRETKTSTRPLWEGRSLMAQYPQLALGVLLLAAGAMGAQPRRSWVEFELLNGNDGALEPLDPSQPVVVDEARDVVHELAQPLLDDADYAPRTGRHCHGCQARPWCTAGSAYVVEHPSPPDHADAGPRPEEADDV
ncbi:hypothetical protein AQ490_22115 [Wenjunlia vitaminophila]|uniref:PD-(D/E)XK endonuclease-like domain-containing protein n=2 Tax=Wenjunlia vitaminophila TaxID=76728 RepID=A0A0T6LSI2_WENVI|nr:hypothetical protein AQ490_22115 [Wenjunlia vitaminophila]